MTFDKQISLIKLTGALALALIVPLAFAACKGDDHEGKTAEPQSVRGKVLTASPVEHPVVSEFPGRLVPRKKALVAPQIMGSLTAVLVDVGDPVKQGQLLFSIDSSTIDAQLRQARAGLTEARAARSQAEAAVAQAQSARDLAELTFNRMQSLFEEKSVSRQQYDQAESGLEMAEAQLAQAKSGLEQVDARIAQAKDQISQVETMQGYSKVSSPLDGVVSMRMMETGEIAAPGHPVVEVISEEKLRFECAIRESLFGTLSAGHPLKVKLDAFPGKEFAASVGQVEPRSDPSSHSLTVRFDLEEYTEPLIVGMFGRLLMTEGAEQAIIVPSAALERRFEGEVNGVWVVEDGRVHFRQLELRADGDDGIVVLNGLKPGERFISPAPQGAVDGAAYEGE